MKLFRRNKVVSIDLKDRVLEECIYYPKKNEVWGQEFYLKEIIEPNHIQISKKGKKAYTGVHDFVYKDAEKQILIKSRRERGAFVIYLYLLMPLIALVGAEEHQLKILCIAIVMFIFITLVLSLGIRSESESIEFDFMQQVNYFKRNNKRSLKKKDLS